VGAGRTTRVAPVRTLHVDVSASSGFAPNKRTYPDTVENSDELARFAAHHLPFYEQLRAQRLDVGPWEPAAPAQSPSCA
jgi:hypothetical protein